MGEGCFDNATKNSERVIINDRQQDSVAIRVNSGEPKPDQLAWMLEQGIGEGESAGSLWQQALKTDDNGHCAL